MRILALDWGQVRVGAAVSDPDGRIAFPLDKFIENESASDEIKKIIIDLKVEKIVIGLPKTLAGEPGASAEKVKAFVDNIQGQVSCKFEFLDERFTSVEAGKILSDAGVDEKKQRLIKDNIAAQIMLQQYLDQRNKI